MTPAGRAGLGQAHVMDDHTHPDGPDPVREPYRPTIRTQADLRRTWAFLMRPLGFSGSSIWMLLLDADGRPHPRLVQLEDCPVRPDPDHLQGLAALARTLLDDVKPGGRWAFLRSRPGSASVTPTDRTWARGILEACRAAGVPTEVVHLATDVDVVPLPYDDLAGVA
jgi:hypothetical protein